MALHTTGAILVTTPGTPVQASVTRIACQSFMVQALPNNQGRIVVGTDNTVRANAASVNPSGNVAATLGVPASNTGTPPSVSYGNPTMPGAFNLQDIWVDATTANDGFIVSYVR